MASEQQYLSSSILDRLVDNNPKVSYEPVQKRVVSIRQLKESLIEDLENLLNSRQQMIPVPVSYEEVNRSILVYGLKDFTSKSPTDQTMAEIEREIKKTISMFEPRLSNVTVHFVKDTGEGTSSKRKNKWWNLRFRIRGTMIVEPIKEPIIFDTVFDINRGRYIISK